MIKCPIIHTKAFYMKRTFLSILLFGALHLSFVSIEENFNTAQEGFQKRWLEFNVDNKKFHVWTKDCNEDELKNRFEQMDKERLQVYFINPEDFSKGIGHYRPNYETPANFATWGSRYQYPLAFCYNLASPNYDASIITLHGTKFVAMEAPTQNNLSEFYQLLQQYHVTDLVRLTPANSKIRENSFPYWEGHISINSKSAQSTLEINGKEINYLFTDCWVDHESIEPEKLLALVKAVMREENPSQMIAVHCRAGVGRTGTFLAAYALIRDIDTQMKNGVDIDHIQVSIDKIFWELSLQRPFMVTKFSQYLTLYRLVDCYIDTLRDESLSTFPFYQEKWGHPSLITPEKSLYYYKNLGLLPSCLPPKTIIFCYSNSLMKKVLANYRMKQCDGMLNKIYLFEDYPDVAIVHFGVGASVNAMRLDYLFTWGVKRCISIGFAGGLQKGLSIGDIIVCDKAIRDEGTSHHYIPAAKYAYPSEEFTNILCQTLAENKIPYHKGASWTTDAFFRQTKEEIQQCQKENVMTVEMEASALFTVASLHGAEIISFFTVSDTLGDLEWKPDFKNVKAQEGLDTLLNVALKVASKEKKTNVVEAIEIVPYDHNWPQMFESEAKTIKSALGDNLLSIHHFGSTSIPGLSAKPKIDILVVVEKLSSIDSDALANLGFENRGEVISTGRYFSKNLPKVHLHIFEKNNPLIDRNLKFRDWLRTHKDDCDAYVALKTKLAAIHKDGMSYCKAKTEFINQIIEKSIKKE